MDNLICRYADAEKNMKQIARIMVLSWQYAYKGIVPQDFLDKLEPERWEKMFERHKDSMTGMVLETGGLIAGCAYFAKTRDEDLDGTYGEIISIYFLPEFCGKGLGAVLLNAVQEKLKERGFINCNIWALKENARARRAYEKNGFKLDGAEKAVEIGGKKLIDVRYIKALQ